MSEEILNSARSTLSLREKALDSGSLTAFNVEEKVLPEKSVMIRDSGVSLGVKRQTSLLRSLFPF